MGVLNFDSLHGMSISRNIKPRQIKIAESIALEKADIIALQEVHTYSFLKILRSKLPDYSCVLYKRFLYGPRGSLVIFSKYPLQNTQYINFRDRGTIFNTSIVAKIRRSGILLGRIKDTNTYIINTHLTQNGDYNWSDRSRFYPFIKSQLNQVAEVINSIHKKELNVIAAGDFNTDSDSKLYKSFINQSEIIDIFKKSPIPTMHQEFLPDHKKVKRIDYIFLRSSSKKAQIKNTEYIFTDKYLFKNGDRRFLSDHIGLKAEFLF
jgi:endonuclease/exonuclease/phosphatase family metal-dependent hydrolase